MSALSGALGERLRGLVHAEAGPGRLVPWVPVAFGSGIALYFTAGREPMAAAAALAALALIVAAFCLRRRRVFPVVALLAAAAAGFAMATLKAGWIAHPILTKTIYAESLKGFVEAREERERTDRFVLRVTDMRAGRSDVRLTRVRLAVRKGAAPAVGSFVELKARLSPPLAPLRPGGYDFARDLYFQKIGASGFVLGAITERAAAGQGGWRLSYVALMQNMRDAIDARIRMVLDGDKRAIATALLTGRRDAISTPVNDAMFISGLGHILSISGYHMAVVAGVVFFALRALLAAFPMLVATFPIKKLAAAMALAAAGFYLLLSGGEVATQRSFFMTAVVLIAVMADRRAITLRTLAVAAMIVLTLAPEALVHPSFQMSFAATLGLVTLVQFGLPRLFAASEDSLAQRAARWGGREVVMLTAASLIAGFATMPFAAFHFHRLAPYGVLANLAAMPAVSGLVMPAGLLGLLAMPFGLDGVFWQLMGFGIDWMTTMALAVAALPGAVGRVPAFGAGALLAMTLGIVVLGLLHTRLRLVGLAIVLLGIVWAALTPRADIVVAADGRAVGVRGGDGRIHVMRFDSDAFKIREWLAADADPRAPADPSLKDGVSCDQAACVVAMRGGALVSLVRRPDAFAEDCERAAVIVTTHQAPSSCEALVIDRTRLERQGALALRQTDAGFRIEASRPRGHDRPWHANLPAIEPDPHTGRRDGSSPHVDATPPADSVSEDAP